MKNKVKFQVWIDLDAKSIEDFGFVAIPIEDSRSSLLAIVSEEGAYAKVRSANTIPHKFLGTWDTQVEAQAAYEAVSTVYLELVNPEPVIA